jgi:hypothetical protein
MHSRPSTLKPISCNLRSPGHYAREYMNRRVRRAPLASWGCAKYLGCYDVVKGAASPCLVGGGCTCTALWASLFHTPPAQLERVSQSKD